MVCLRRLTGLGKTSVFLCGCDQLTKRSWLWHSPDIEAGLIAAGI
jgi:hypothetical protein